MAVHVYMYLPVVLGREGEELALSLCVATLSFSTTEDTRDRGKVSISASVCVWGREGGGDDKNGLRYMYMYKPMTRTKHTYHVHVHVIELPQL